MNLRKVCQVILISSWNLHTTLSDTPLCHNATGLCSVGPKLDPTKLLETYPELLSDDPPINDRILCPFLRLLERYDLVDSDMAPLFTIGAIIEGGSILGNPKSQSLLASTGASLGQLVNGETKFNRVNLEALHAANMISHDCGITYALGGDKLDYSVINSSIAVLTELEDDEGHLTLEDLDALKGTICDSQGVEMTLVGYFENRLLWNFLGGNERDFIETSDVDRILHTKLPLTLH